MSDTYYPWPPADEDEDDRRPVPVGDELDEPVPPAFVEPLEELRFVRASGRTTTDKIAYAVHGAYGMPAGVWRQANVVFAYAVAAPGHVLCDAIKWALFDRLSRFLLAVPVLVLVAFLLNHVPVLAWLVPDQWDVSAVFAPAPPDPGVIEVPLDVPAGD